MPADNPHSLPLVLPSHILAAHLCVVSSLAAILAAHLATPGRRCWLKDTRGRYLWANDSFAGEVCREPSAIIGRTTEEVWPLHHAELRAADSRVLAGAGDVAALPCCADAVEVHRSPVLDASGIVVGVVGYFDRGQSEAHRAAEVQLLLSHIPDASMDQVCSGLEALREEFT